MSSAVVSTSAALGRHFIFDDESNCVSSPHPEEKKKCAESISRGVEGSLRSTDSRLAHIIPASRLEIRPAPEMVSCGIADLDALTGGLPRGCLTEICGPASSGRTTVLLATLTAATRRGEFCALIDASDSLDPDSAATSGLEFDRLLWVRCSADSRQIPTEKKTCEGTQNNFQLPRSVILSAAKAPSPASAGKGFSGNFNPHPAGSALPESMQSSSKKNPKNQTHPDTRQFERRLDQVLRATDLLLESGGFGLITLDLADLPPQAARRIPLTTWFRFRRAIEHTPTILLVIEQQPIAGSCSSLLLQLSSTKGSQEQSSWGKQEIHPRQESSREAAIWENPARQCWVVNSAAKNESRRDPTKLPVHADLFTGLEINAELICSRLERRPVRSVAFATKTAWAG